MKTWRHFIQEEQGATAMEYAIIASLISIIIIVGLQGIGSNMNSKYSQVNGQLPR